MSQNIISDDRNAPRWRNIEGDALPLDWQKYLESYTSRQDGWKHDGLLARWKDRPSVVFRKD